MGLVLYELRHVLDSNSLHATYIKEASILCCSTTVRWRREFFRSLIAHDVEAMGQRANNIFVVSDNGEWADGGFQGRIRTVAKE
jgi:hypothetical protein